MGSGCENLIAELLPSSARQLPILAALHARLSTLFADIIHHLKEKVNTFLQNMDIFLSIKEAASAERRLLTISGYFLKIFCQISFR